MMKFVAVKASDAWALSVENEEIGGDRLEMEGGWRWITLVGVFFGEFGEISGT
jgi:hypothetical protein